MTIAQLPPIAVFALNLAQKIRANITVASYSAEFAREDLKISETGSLVLQRSELLKTLFAHKKRLSDFRPVIQELELSGFTPEEIFRLTNDRDIYLVVRGMNEFLPSALLNINVCITTLLGEIKCPVLVVPSSWDFSEFRKLVYLTDLRFCGIRTVNYIVDLAREWNSQVVIAHSKVSGLPEIDHKEANDIFVNEVHSHVNYKNVSMSMLDKARIPYIIKTVVHHYHADLLVFVNQHFHFDTFTKQYFKDRCALYEPVPMLIFPY